MVMLDSSALEELKKIVLLSLRGTKARVYLFGSQARGTAGMSSDIDIAIDGSAEDMPYRISCLRETLEESSFPWRVDVVDMHRTAANLRKGIEQEGILWSD